jgi:hypothetical protein
LSWFVFVAAQCLCGRFTEILREHNVSAAGWRVRRDALRIGFRVALRQR